MATQTTTVAAFQTLCAEVADAIAAATWSTAYSKYAQAEAVNAALELDVAAQGSSIRRRETLSGLGKALQMAEGAVARTTNKGRFITTRQGFKS